MNIITCIDIYVNIDYIYLFVIDGFISLYLCFIHVVTLENLCGSFARIYKIRLFQDARNMTGIREREMGKKLVRGKLKRPEVLFHDRMN